MYTKLLIRIVLESWDILSDSSIYILIGLFLSGILYVFFKPENIIKYLGKGKISSVFFAALIGMPLPLCSCAVVPTAITLNKQGASKASVSSFLISTPETSVDSIALSYVLLDPMLTIFRPVSALIAAVFSGVMEIIFGKKSKKINNMDDKRCKLCCDDEGPHTHSLFEKIIAALKYGFVELIGDIGGWLIFGIVIAAAISVLLPPEVLTKYLNGNFNSMIIMLAIGIPAYICASASTPIAASLIFKGLNPGAALVFLLTGPATNITSIILLLKYFGKRSVLIYLLSIALVSLIMGSILDFLYQYFSIDAQASVGHVRELFPLGLKCFFGGLLVIIMINAIYRRKKCKSKINYA